MSRIERIPSSGSCARCQGSLELTSVKVDGRWYCSASCARGGGGPLERRVSEVALYSRPRRFFRKRAPKELKRVGGA